jgi:hypothetical protein
MALVCTASAPLRVPNPMIACVSQTSSCDWPGVSRALCSQHTEKLPRTHPSHTAAEASPLRMPPVTHQLHGIIGEVGHDQSDDSSRRRSRCKLQEADPGIVFGVQRRKQFQHPHGLQYYHAHGHLKASSASRIVNPYSFHVKDKKCPTAFELGLPEYSGICHSLAGASLLRHDITGSTPSLTLA